MQSPPSSISKPFYLLVVVHMFWPLLLAGLAYYTSSQLGLTLPALLPLVLATCLLPALYWKRNQSTYQTYVYSDIRCTVPIALLWWALGGSISFHGLITNGWLIALLLTVAALVTLYLAFCYMVATMKG